MITLHRRIQLLIATLLSLGLMLVMVGIASAHAIYPAHAKVNKAIPAIGSTVSQAPATVTVFTLENINPDPGKSNLFVYDPAGDLISQGNAKVSLTNPREMSITIKPDPANINGIYVVQWKTVSALDGDPDQGAFTFIVQPGAATTPTPVTTTTTNQGTIPPTSTTSGTGGIALWVPIVVGIVALLIGLGAGLGLGRRGSTSSIGSIRKTVAQQQQEEEATRHP